MQIMRNEQEAPFESSAQRQDGSTYPVEVIGRSIPYRGRVVSVVAIRDITERKQAEKAEETRLQLERQLIQSERMASVGMVAAGIVHNLKNPLTGVLGFGQLLSIKHPELDEASKIVSSAKQMEEMIENILAKSRQKKRIEPVDLNGLLERELDFLKADNMYKMGVRSDVQLSLSIPKIECVYTDLSQAFGNLIRNAIEAMQDEEEKTIGLSTSLDEEEGVVVTISDTGCGIADSDLENLFEPFYTTKNDPANLEGPEGTGLGLYMVQQVLKPYGASIHVDSKQGIGTTF